MISCTYRTVSIMCHVAVVHFEAAFWQGPGVLSCQPGSVLVDQCSCVSVSVLCPLQVVSAPVASFVHGAGGALTLVCPNIPAADQSAAMRVTFRQLADMQAPVGTVWLQGWQWSAVADTVAECLRALPDLHTGWDTPGPLIDELLRAAMHMGPHMRSVRAERLALQSDHSAVLWPWSELGLRQADAGQLLRLPSPSLGALLTIDTLSLAALRGGAQVRHKQQKTVQLRLTKPVCPLRDTQHDVPLHGWVYRHTRCCTWRLPYLG